MTTTPESATSGHAASRPAAIAADALPAPTTMHLPLGFAGRASAIVILGSALAMAASKIRRRAVRARTSVHLSFNRLRSGR
ncbi:hypothetical protein J2R76_002483 [Bradyrhizobium sp. USDA 4532]|nr:hypothetical protein [Bradyrhizobium sp. USDA 4545]MCP1918892.1 hypothetical protein [Bradyrhizobium sp. USDA 4532]